MERFIAAGKRILSESRPVRFCISRVFLFSRVNLPFRMTFNRQPLVQTRLHASSAAHKLFIGKYDAVLDIAVFKHFIRTKSTVIDVGANIGLFSSLAAKQATQGKVFAVEATPSTFRYMVDTLSLNESANAVPIFGAVSPERGQVFLHDHAHSKEQNFITKAPGGTPVPSFRVDDLLTLFGIDTVQFLKIDVEGAELPVIESCGERLNDIEVIYFECLPETYERYDYTFAELHTYLNNQGFQIYAPALEAGALKFSKITPESRSTDYANNLVASKLPL